MHKNQLFLLFAFACLVMIIGCGSKKEEPLLRVVNVLDKEFYDDAHLTGSICVPFGDVEAASAEWNKETPVVVYCANYACTASGESARQLTQMGFKHAFAYEGGTAEWYELSKQDPKQYPFTGPATQSYLTADNKPFETSHEGFTVITAHDLSKKMREAGLIV